MADLDRIKRNVAKMAAQNAPEADIDGYIASEGVTIDQVKNHKIGPMSWADVGSQAVSNIPKSAGEFAGNIAHAVMHPIDTVSALGDVAYGGLSKAAGAVGVPMEPAAKAEREKSFDAVMQFFGDRYGGLENFKRTLAEDPIGLAADLSTVLTAGGTAGARLPGVAGKTAQVVQAAGRAVDPVSAAAKGTRAVASGVVAPMIGLTTGTGADAVHIAARSGFQGNRAFLENMRGNAGLDDAVDMAKSALGEMRRERSDAYRKGIGATKADKTKLQYTPILQSVNDAWAKAHFNGVPLDDEAANVVRQVNDKVQQFRAMPSLAYRTAEGLDALKQSIGEIRQRTKPNTLARTLVDGVYNTVKTQIVKQVPEYAKTMKDYAQASDRINDIAKTFSISERASPDTTARKLLSVMRNNANTNYGRRASLMDELARHERDLLPALAGQTMSSPTPRGLAGLGAFGAGIGGITHMNPYSIAALPFMSPRLMGEAAYGAGRVGGLLGSSAQSIGATLPRVSGGLLGLYQAGNVADATETPLRGGIGPRYDIFGNPIQ